MGEVVELKIKERIEELFSVTSIVRLSSCGVMYEAVPVSWFACGRKAPPIPFARMLTVAERSEEDQRYAEAAACELFTRDEAQLITDWLQRAHGEDTHRTDIVSAGRVPLDLHGVMPLGATPTGPGAGPHIYTFDADEPDGPPLDVGMYFDTRFVEGQPDPDEPWPDLESAATAQAAERR